VNVHISPKVIAAAKTLNFSHNDDHTYVGCTSVITPFAVPWRSADAINEALADDRYFNESTFKMPEDSGRAARARRVPSAKYGT
jgi:hypothetical protein